MKWKYQSGGVVSYTPYIPQSGVAQTSDSGSSSKQEKITGTLQKEIIDVLKENGIQNDVDGFLSEANAFLTKSQHLTNMSLFGGEDDSYTMSHLIGVLSMANRVKQNKLQWDEATEKLKSENAWNEVAVSSNGYIYVYGDNGLKTVSSEEYSKNRDKYQALTNSQVLGLREQDPNLAFKSNILQDLSGAIGMKTITDQLVDIVNKFGHYSRTEYIKNTGNAISQSAYDGMQILLGQGPQGYYKATTKSEKENVKSALAYLWQAIGSDGQKRLRAETAISGGDPNRNQYDLLMQVLEHHTDYEQSVDFDKTATDFELENSPEGKAVKTKYVEINNAIRLGTGQDLGVPQSIPIITKAGGTRFMIFAQNAGKVVDSEGNPLESTNLEQMLNKADAIKGLAITDSISFGDQLLHESDYSKVMFNSKRNIYRTEMPYKEVEPGKFVPDFELHNKLNIVQANLKGKPVLRQNILSELKKVGIDEYDVYIDNQGRIFARNTMPFLVLGGIGGSGSFGFNEESNFLNSMGREEGNRYKNEYNNIIRSGESYNDKDITGNRKTRLGGNMYEGNIFIAIDPTIAAHVGGTTKAPEAALVDVTQQNMNTPSGMITNF